MLVEIWSTRKAQKAELGNANDAPCRRLMGLAGQPRTGHTGVRRGGGLARLPLVPVRFVLRRLFAPNFPACLPAATAGLHCPNIHISNWAASHNKSPNVSAMSLYLSGRL